MKTKASKHINLSRDAGSVMEQVPEFPSDLLHVENPLEIFRSAVVKASHSAEPDLFARHEEIPAHSQRLLGEASIAMLGAGGLNSAAGVGLARSGAGTITVVDHDLVELSNLSRQFFHEADLGRPKAICLARNLATQAFDGATITGIGLRFADAAERYVLPADIFVVGVDNNECRLQAAREARRRRIPAVFTMLSTDGMRCHAFLQGPSALDPCLWCALPNLDPERTLHCASAVISSCFLAAAFTVFFVHRALMGWGPITPFNWRESDLSGMSPDKTGTIQKSATCEVCGRL